MTRDAARDAARALLDAMAGTTEGEWSVVTKGNSVQSHAIPGVCSGISPKTNNGRYIARACPARLGPVLRALMGED